MHDSRLRGYQRDAIAAVYGAWMHDRGRRQIIAAATGAGKTKMTLSTVVDCLKAGHRVIWFAHRKVLLDQALASFQDWWPDLADKAGIVQAVRNDWSKQFVIASIDTARNPKRLKDILAAGPFRLAVVDECHRSLSPTYIKVLHEIERAGHGQFTAAPGPDSPLFLGLSATPARADGQALGKYWRIAYTYPITRGIAEGFLVPPRFVVEQLKIDLSEVATRAGDWNDKDLEETLMRGHVVDHTVRHMVKHAWGLKTIVFCVLVRQAEATAAALNAAGFRAEVISDKTPDADRDQILTGLKEGTVDVICNCSVLTEGYDESSIQCVAFARPTQSKPLYIQCVGRGLRIFPGKSECLVLDLVGASLEHDLFVSAALIEESPQVESKPRECGDCGSYDVGYRPRLDGTGGVALTCRACGWQAERQEQERTPWSTFLKERKRSEFVWVPVPEVSPRAWALDAGREGFVALVQVDDAAWLSVVFRKPKRNKDGEIIRKGGIDYPAGDKPLDQQTAQGAAEDFIRQAELVQERESIARKGQNWRGEPGTESQASMMRRLKITEIPKTKGERAALITAKLAQQKLVAKGFCERVRKGGS